MQQFHKVLAEHSGALKFQQQWGTHLIAQPPLAPSLLTLPPALTPPLTNPSLLSAFFKN